MLRSGRGLPDTLRTAALLADPELRQIMRIVAPALEHGESLSSALAPFRSRLPRLFLPVLEVGETSGKLDAAMQRLADAFSAEDGFEAHFRYTIFNPWAVKLVIIVEMIRFVLGGAYVPAIVLAALLILYGMQFCRLAVDKISLALPYVGVVERNVAAVRWARSFSTLWQAGVPVSAALRISARSTLNAYYERAIRKAEDDTLAGRSLAESLAGTQLLPAHLLTVIAAGEESGRLGEALDHFITALQAEAQDIGNRAFIVSTVAIVLFLLLLMSAIGTIPTPM
jgi:type II secretory pathway component PulF